jgi:hypothetical protein
MVHNIRKALFFKQNLSTNYARNGRTYPQVMHHPRPEPLPGPYLCTLCPQLSTGSNRLYTELYTPKPKKKAPDRGRNETGFQV